MSSPKKSSRARHDERFIAHQAAWIKSDRSESVALLVDVSESGARIRADRPLPTGGQLTLAWKPVPGGPTMEFESSVLWTERGLSGLRFFAADARRLKLLRALVRFHRG